MKNNLGIASFQIKKQSLHDFLKYRIKFTAKELAKLRNDFFVFFILQIICGKISIMRNKELSKKESFLLQL